MGAQTSYTTEEAGVAKAIVNGAQTTQAMQNLLKIYIEKFVLCKQCHLPESHYKIKSDLINYSCKACGAKGPIDMTHKVCNFILKQHATAKKEAKKNAEKGDKKEHKKDKKEKEKKEKKEKTEESSSSSKKDKEDGEEGIEKEKKKKSKKHDVEPSSADGALPPHPPSESSPKKKVVVDDEISDKAALGRYICMIH